MGCNNADKMLKAVKFIQGVFYMIYHRYRRGGGGKKGRGGMVSWSLFNSLLERLSLNKDTIKTDEQINKIFKSYNITK